MCIWLIRGSGPDMCVLVLTNSCCVRICLIFRVFLAQTVYIVAITAGGMEYGFVLFLLATALNSMSNRISCDIYIDMFLL